MHVLCVCVRVCVCVCMRVCVHVCVYVIIGVNAFVWINVCMCTHLGDDVGGISGVFDSLPARA